MSEHYLCSPRQAEDAVARFFSGGNTGRIEVIEETAFNAAALHFGTLTLSALDAEPQSLKSAVRNGSFEWLLPTADKVMSDLEALCDVKGMKEKDRPAAIERLKRLIADMADIAVRLELTWPRFDALAVANMPLKRPATVVADTTGVLQGALTFVARHLHPMARLKIPAVLHMEVINQADRFITVRRKIGARRDVVLGEHLKSQAGQRVLLRLEMREDTEVERNLLIGDPLRSAFREERDADLKEFNLDAPVKSYVDRMILESARQHQAYASPGHPVHLLTGDQGLARMALSEGINPLFFKKSRPDQFFGAKLTGANFSPFTGKIVSTSVSSVLWELATVFGRARLTRDSDGALIEVTAIDKELGWSAFHSQGDLLWFRTDKLPSWPKAEKVAPNKLSEETPPPINRSNPNKKLQQTKKNSKPSRISENKAPRLSETNAAGVAFYRVNINGLVALIDLLSRTSRVDDKAVMEAVGLRHPTGVAEYRRFLLSGGLIEQDVSYWTATDRLIAIGTAFREGDMQRVAEGLSATPSYAAFIRLLREVSVPGRPVELPIPARVLPSYLALGEITCMGMSIPEEGYYATLANPDLNAFVSHALERYQELAPEKGWVASGDWLEALARKDGIHPVRARDSLQEAAAADLIRRWTEGSTTDTRHDDHTLRVVAIDGGRPKIETVYLYRGDFLMPEKSSSSLKLEAPRA